MRLRLDVHANDLEPGTVISLRCPAGSTEEIKEYRAHSDTGFFRFIVERACIAER
jgi:hypothetical protein